MRVALAALGAVGDGDGHSHFLLACMFPRGAAGKFGAGCTYLEGLCRGGQVVESWCSNLGPENEAGRAHASSWPVPVTFVELFGPPLPLSRELESVCGFWLRQY